MEVDVSHSITSYFRYNYEKKNKVSNVNYNKFAFALTDRSHLYHVVLVQKFFILSWSLMSLLWQRSMNDRIITLIKVEQFTYYYNKKS